MKWQQKRTKNLLIDWRPQQSSTLGRGGAFAFAVSAVAAAAIPNSRRGGGGEGGDCISSGGRDICVRKCDMYTHYIRTILLVPKLNHHNQQPDHRVSFASRNKS